MVKRIIIYAVCFLMCFSSTVLADEVNDATQQQTDQTIQQEMRQDFPMQGERMGGRPREFGRQMPTEGQRPPEITMPDSGNMPDFQVPDNGNMPKMPQDDEYTTDDENTIRIPRGGMGGEGQFGGFPWMQDSAGAQTAAEAPTTFKSILTEYFTPIVSLVLLALAFVFVIFYKRKNY